MVKEKIKMNRLCKLVNFCYGLRTALNKKYFMDDPNVTTAINNNHPSELTKLTDRFIGEALSHIEKFGDCLAYIK